MDIVQQIITKISQVSSILIIGSGSSGDSLASSLALRSFLKKLEKDVTLLTPTEIASKFEFLPEITEVSRQVDLTKSFVVDLSTKKTEVAELSYRKEQDKLAIYLKPKKGEFSREDVSFRSSSFPYELIVTVGISSLEQLGDFYSQNASLFFETPLINIDFRAGNENYAQINLVNLSSTSCSEIVLDLINKFESSLIDENIATQLLTGIIDQTNSFQHVRTTPQTFLKASQLVSLGAKQQEIIAHLYKSKSLGLLKLWGRVLARLKQDNEIGLVYSAVNRSDLLKSEASDQDATLIIKEMVSQLAFAKILLFLKEETDNQTTVFAHSFIPLNLMSIFKEFAPNQVSGQTVRFVMQQPVMAAEKQAIDLIRQELNKIRPTQ